MSGESILWRRLDRPGHDSARLVFRHARWRLAGTAVFEHEARPCRLDYHVICDEHWRTMSAGVEGWVGREPVVIAIVVDSAHRWSMNSHRCATVEGCIDIDLAFTPATNLLPIRRLRLAESAEAPVRAAWLRFPGFALEVLDQRYHRLRPDTYRYESNGGRFVAELEVDASGFVTRYSDIWERVASAAAR